MRKEMGMIEEVGIKISMLSDTLYIAGNDRVSKKLDMMYSSISKSLKNIDNIIDSHVTEEYRNSQQASVNVLNAALAGIKLKERE